MAISVQKKLKWLGYLPGGNGKYLESLTRCLEFVEKNKPSEEQLYAWFLQAFPSVHKPSVVKNCIRTIEVLELMARINGNFSVTNMGREFLQKRENRLVYQKLSEKIGVEVVLLLLQERTLTLDELSPFLKEAASAGWKTPQQARIRLNWLQSLGIVKKTAGRYGLTEEGKALAKGASKNEENLLEHSKIQHMILEIGRFGGSVTEPEFRVDGFRLDAIWKNRTDGSPSVAWEVVRNAGLLRNAFSNLKQARERWNCELFLATPEELESKACQVLSSAFSEIASHTRILNFEKVSEWYEKSEVDYAITKEMGFTRRVLLRQAGKKRSAHAARE